MIISNTTVDLLRCPKKSVRFPCTISGFLLVLFMEELHRYQELLTVGGDFSVTYNDKSSRNSVWFSPSYSTVHWAESRKAWRQHEKRVTGIAKIATDGSALIIPVGKKSLVLSSSEPNLIADWNKALNLLCGTSTPFDVKHHSHVDTNMEWTGDISSHFIVEAFLGKGSFGSVMRVCHKDSGVVMAAKLIVADNSGEIKKEIDVLRACKHSSIVAYYGCASEPDIDGNLWILMDYCDAGDVGVLLKQHGPLPEPVIQYIMLQATR